MSRVPYPRGRRGDLGNHIAVTKKPFLFLNLKGKIHDFVLIFEVDKLNCWVVLSGLLLRASPCWLFCLFLQDQDQDKGVDRTGKPLGKNQPSTWTKSTRGSRAKALKKLGKSEGFWPSWRREREGNSLPRRKKKRKEKEEIKEANPGNHLQIQLNQQAVYVTAASCRLDKTLLV